MLTFALLGTHSALAGSLLITTDQPMQIDDPLEPLNRIIFALDRGVRRYGAMPVLGLHFILGDLHIPYRLATGTGRILDNEVSFGYLRDGVGDIYPQVRALEYARSRGLCLSTRFISSDRT